MGVDERLASLSADLDRLAEELSEAAMDVLREAIEEGAESAATRAKALERRLNRARAAVERAARLLEDGATTGEAGEADR